MIALIDRGACAVSLKIDAAASAGAIGVLIGLVAPGDAVTFCNGGGTNFVPSLVITQAPAPHQGRAGRIGRERHDQPEQCHSAAGNIASYSSRGPNYSYNMLKPDMSAPGTIMRPQPGTGNGADHRKAGRLSAARSRLAPPRCCFRRTTRSVPRMSRRC